MANNNFVQRYLWVLWPAFLVASVAELLFFAVIDPMDVYLFGKAVEADRMSIYTLGFLFFWLVAAAASFLTVFLQRSPFDVNRDASNSDTRPQRPSERDVADV
jgi:hypothetical protein